VAAVGSLELLTHHADWALTARYAGQVKAKNCAVKDIQKGNRELLQKNARFETRIRELNDELMRITTAVTS
jgi:hypothetical protein